MKRPLYLPLVEAEPAAGVPPLEERWQVLLDLLAHPAGPPLVCFDAQHCLSPFLARRPSRTPCLEARC
jgi:hypothetical protein